MLNIYIHNPIIDSSNRPFLVDILKPVLPQIRLSKYGLDINYLTIVESPENADYFLLPFIWDYYLRNKIISQAISLIKISSQLNKRILIWVTGDNYCQLPLFENIIGLYTSIYRSKTSEKEISLPVIIRDPLQLMKMDEIIIKATLIS